MGICWPPHASFALNDRITFGVASRTAGSCSFRNGGTGGKEGLDAGGGGFGGGGGGGNYGGLPIRFARARAR